LENNSKGLEEEQVMNTNKTQRIHKIPVVALLLVTTIILQGCVVFLTSVATVVWMKSSNHLTTIVLIKKEPATASKMEREPNLLRGFGFRVSCFY
jgi:hypothetical protein